ncbi:MAG: GLPGLI family protein [Muribaculaceae bacterium]|nr:GLPGLI family protein [Muribaculaceae bacterium]
MNRLITSIIVCLATIAAMAQTADIEVSYNMRSFYANGVEKNNKYHLLANSTFSKFFNPQSEEIDSLTSTPEGLANFKKTQEAVLKAMISQGQITVDKLPRKKVTGYVIKSAQDSTITVYEMLRDEHVYYTEPFSEMVWEIGDSTKNVLGYECIQATTDYHGREWTVWFTPDIPIQDGPWKLRGLPGLILEATTGDGIGFFADGIEQTAKQIRNVYGAEKYEKQNRKDILRARRAMIDNPIGSLTATGSLEGVKIESNELKPKSESFDFLETDYRK